MCKEGQKHTPAKLNLELSGDWPASGVLSLIFTGLSALQVHNAFTSEERKRNEVRPGSGSRTKILRGCATRAET